MQVREKINIFGGNNVGGKCLFIPRAVKGHWLTAPRKTLRISHLPSSTIQSSTQAKVGTTTWPNGVSLFVRFLPRPPSSSSRFIYAQEG